KDIDGRLRERVAKTTHHCANSLFVVIAWQKHGNTVLRQRWCGHDEAPGRHWPCARTGLQSFLKRLMPGLSAADHGEQCRTLPPSLRTGACRAGSAAISG